MKRGPTGYYFPVSVLGETCRAFVPHPLPPNPALEWDTDLTDLNDSAAIALGCLDGITLLLPDPALFLYAYIRKEAVLSSQIEGTQSSLSDLFRALAPLRSRDDLRNVVEGIEAMGKEEAAYWLGMAMHRKNPRRVLSALRILLTAPRPKKPIAYAATNSR